MKTTTRLLVVLNLHRSNPSGFYRFFARVQPLRFLRWMVKGEGNWVLPASAEEIVEWLWSRWGIEEQHRVLQSGVGAGQERSWGIASGVGTLVWGYWLCGVLVGVRAV